MNHHRGTIVDKETPPIAEAYDLDFYSWANRQAELLRAGRTSEADLEHLAEEIEDLGKSVRRALASHIRTVVEHLMKLQASPAAQARNVWAATVQRARADIEDILDDSPSLRRDLPGIIIRQTSRAQRLVADDLARYGEAPTIDLGGIGYTEEQVLGPWLP